MECDIGTFYVIISLDGWTGIEFESHSFSTTMQDLIDMAPSRITSM
jgi:hypothetical protein